MESIHNDNEEELTALQRRRRMAEKRSLLTGNRGIDEYREFSGIDTKKLKGKLILDIGSGFNEKFKVEAENLGAKVFSSSLHSKPIGPSVYARAQEIPFQDNIFDYEVALFSVPYYVEGEEEFEAVISEVLRTLKPGGQGYFSPILIVQKVELEEVLRKFSDFISYDFKPLPESLKDLLFGENVYRLIITKKDIKQV